MVFLRFVTSCHLFMTICKVFIRGTQIDYGNDVKTNQKLIK